MTRMIRYYKKGKITLIYVGPFYIFKRVGEVSYEFELPTKLEVVSLIFHILFLIKFVGDQASIVPLVCVIRKTNINY